MPIIAFMAASAQAFVADLANIYTYILKSTGFQSPCRQLLSKSWALQLQSTATEANRNLGHLDGYVFEQCCMS